MVIGSFLSSVLYFSLNNLSLFLFLVSHAHTHTHTFSLYLSIYLSIFLFLLRIIFLPLKLLLEINYMLLLCADACVRVPVFSSLFNLAVSLTNYRQHTYPNSFKVHLISTNVGLCSTPYKNHRSPKPLIATYVVANRKWQLTKYTIRGQPTFPPKQLA